MSATELIHNMQRGMLSALLLSGAGFAETAFDAPDLGSQMYPRLIRLAHSGDLNGRLLATFDCWDPGSVAPIFESSNEGKTWTEIARFPHRDGCCSTLYELPKTFGDNPEGTLIWATSFHNIVESGIEIWRSLDHGHTWAYYSTPVRGTTGLWEPEFAVNGAGQLQMFFASEEHKADGFDQTIDVMTTMDLKTFTKEHIVIGIPDSVARPGMPIVRQGKNGTFFMVYEICGTGCDVFFRSSTDSVNWGDPQNPGRRIESQGKFFRHAPNFTMLGDTLYVIGQTYHNPDATLAPENGQVVLVGQEGVWTEIQSPVQVPDVKGDTSPPYEFSNYSSAMVPGHDGKTLLGLAMRSLGEGLYKVFFGIAPLP